MYDERCAEEELAALAVEDSIPAIPIESGPRYWENRHLKLDERLRDTNGQ
jgi:hypothetical protein